MVKMCFKCRRKKDIILFYTHKAMGDKHLGKCKQCTKKDVKNRYYDPKYRKQIQKYEKRRNNNPKRKEYRLLYQRNRRRKYPGKENTRRKTYKAIIEGRLIKQVCQNCGKQKAQAHHNDYRSYLNITWLCFKCHRKLHNGGLSNETINKQAQSA